MKAVNHVKIAVLVVMALVCSCKQPAHAADLPDDVAIARMLQAWRADWQSRDINRYAGYYNDSFSYKGNDRSWWLTRKKRFFAGSRALTVRLSGVCIHTGNKGTATARFVQRYSSDSVTDIGIKTLVLQKGKGRWGIVNETWKKLVHDTTPAASGQVEVLSISVVPGMKKNETSVRFYLNRFAAPEVKILGAANSIILRFHRMAQWDGLLSIPVSRGPIRSIQTYLTNRCDDFVAVITLRNDRGPYAANQFYYKQEKIFEMRISADSNP